VNIESAFFSIRLSFQVALVATVFTVLCGCAIAFLLARRKFIGKDLLDVLFTLPLVLPPTVTGYILLVLFGAGGILGKYMYDMTGYTLMFTWQAAALCSFVVSMPLMYKTTRAAFESVDIKLIHASFTLGHSELRTFFSVILPLSRRGLIAGTILAFARALGEFGATLMLAGNIPGKTDTMPLAIYADVATGEWNRAWGMVLLFTLMSVAFLYIANKLTGNQRWV
jgi:molybdate transport system permease protein